MAGKFFLFKYEEGDIIVSRKKHPCGSSHWILKRVGADCKLECEGCGRMMVANRPVVERMTSSVIRGDNVIRVPDKRSDFGR